jgi:S-adenosyl-L-methionine hydrolase (adenosine-forming)
MALRVARPIITLTSDFGLSDAYVATMKAVILRSCPQARLIDVTHNVPRRDILCGSITLERAVDGFPEGTVHLAVVDPGVGTERRIISARIKRQFIVCPDNGLITWSWRMHGGGEAWEIIWRPTKSSATFHGRDIMAPVAARLASGVELDEIAHSISDPVMLDLEPVREARSSARIIHIDHFGNATTNVPLAVLREMPAVTVKVRNKTIGKLRRTYWDVPPGKPLALIGSSGLLEIAVRDGSAKEDLKVRVGDEVQLKA